MAINPEWGKRLRDAKRAWEHAHDPRRLSYAAIGKEVARIVGRASPFSHAAARAWFNGQEPETFAIARAIEEVLDQPPGALIIGRSAGETAAPGTIEPEILRPANDEEMKAGEAWKASQQQPPTKTPRNKPNRRTG